MTRYVNSKIPETVIQVKNPKSFSIVTQEQVKARVSLAPTTGGIFTYASGRVPPNNINQDVLVKAEGFNFSVPKPQVILLQSRQSDNNVFNWPDQFALQVIETSSDFIKFLVRRLDNHADPTQWGQELRIDFLIVDDGTQ